jgi:hypothetical protein
LVLDRNDDEVQRFVSRPTTSVAASNHTEALGTFEKLHLGDGVRVRHLKERTTLRGPRPVRLEDRRLEPV